MPQYLVEQLEIENLKEALDLVWKVFLEFEAPIYSQEGIQEFKNYLDYTTMKNKLLNKIINIWICKNNDTIIGVLAVYDPCHISLLFVEKEHHRKGIATNMFNNMIKYYKKDYEKLIVTVNSSPYAHDFYCKLGFVDIENEKTVNGIRFIPMQYMI